MIRVLLSNDDGAHAYGLKTLVSLLKDFAHLDVIAPDRNRSGASSSLTLNTPLHIKHLDNGFISVEGTPTDCVHLALTGLLKILPDMVISGINAGSNLGDDVWYSGTVAAAMEGRFLGCPSLAISLVGSQYQHFDTAAQVAFELMQHLFRDPLPARTILNVNVPDLLYVELEGFEITRLGTRHRSEPIIEQTDPRGNPIYWVGPAGAGQDSCPGTDFHAIAHRKVSITPLQIDLTNYEAFDKLAHWVCGLNQE